MTMLSERIQLASIKQRRNSVARFARSHNDQALLKQVRQMDREINELKKAIQRG